MRLALIPMAIGTFATLTSTAAIAEDGRLTHALKVEQAVRANLLPFSPAYVAPQCLVPYPLCKAAYATVSLVAAGEQLLTGGDVKGAKAAISRGFTGPWVVRPTNVSGQAIWSAPPPVPLVAYFSTGRSNHGNQQIDPLPAASRAEFEGDVLPP